MVSATPRSTRVRFAYNCTDIHRTHEPLFFSAPEVGINTYSYMADYMLLTVTAAASSSAAAPRARRASRRRRINFTDDLTLIGATISSASAPASPYWKSLSLANVRSPGQFTFDGHASPASAGRLHVAAA